MLNKQVEMHPYLPQNELVEYCRQQGMLITAYSPFGCGREPYLLKDPVLVELSQQLNMTPAQLIVSWSVQRGTGKAFDD
jgi:alcohol dehydrogenase (NADP+)